MKIGFVVSDQERSMQMRALMELSCKDIITDDMKAAVDILKKGDTLIVWRVDKLGKGLADIKQTLAQIEQKGAYVELISEGISSRDKKGDYFSSLIELIAKL